MKKQSWASLSLLALLISFTSCFKEDLAYQLPPADTTLNHQQVVLGEDYEHQIFFSLEHNAMVYNSPNNAWDLAFESHADGFRVFMNGGQDVKMYCMGKQPFNTIVAEQSINWGFDFPGGLPNDSYVGDWRTNSQNGEPDLYFILLPDQSIVKMQLVSVDDKCYQIKYARLQDTLQQKFTVAKDTNYVFAYLKFENGQTAKSVQPDPVKTSFEIVFRRYKHIYLDLNNFPYLVNGAMLNPYGVTATIDSIKKFDDISVDDIPYYTWSKNQDIIGFDWKEYDFIQSKYIVRPMRTYLIRRDDGACWKLRFTDFYDKLGQKGYPAFEFKRLN